MTADRSSVIGGEQGFGMGRRGSVVALASARCALRLYAHGQVDEGEDVVLDHDGEAEEDGVQDQDVNAQLEVQPPFVQVDAQNLCGHAQQSSGDTLFFGVSLLIRPTMSADQHTRSVILQLFLEIQSLKMISLSQSAPEGGRSCSALMGLNSNFSNFVCFPLPLL